MSENFRVRVIVGLGLFIVAVVSLYILDSWPFRILYTLFAIVATIELISFFKQKHFSALNIILAVFELIFIAGSIAFVMNANPTMVWYVILGVPGYDVFAYLFGKSFGGKIFKNSRPFPKISKNKTWEGTIMGVIMSLILVTIMLVARGEFATDWPYLLCAPLAVIGDLFESYLKRKFRIKDSNEIVIKNRFFAKLEILVGGSNGHGGFLDRIDSVAFATAILFIIIKFVVS